MYLVPNTAAKSLTAFLASSFCKGTTKSDGIWWIKGREIKSSQKSLNFCCLRSISQPAGPGAGFNNWFVSMRGAAKLCLMFPGGPSPILGPSHHFLVVWDGFPPVAIGEEQHLGVAVDGDDGFHVAVGADEIRDGSHFPLGVGVRATIGLRAGIAAGASTWSRSRRCREDPSGRVSIPGCAQGLTSKPSVPISVGIHSDTAGSSVDGPGLAPQAVLGAHGEENGTGM